MYTIAKITNNVLPHKATSSTLGDRKVDDVVATPGTLENVVSQ